MKFFSFIGWSKSGKTTLISSLIKELSGRGFNVLAVKKIPDRFHVEPEGKDSRKFLDSGAETVYLIAEKQLMKMRQITDPKDFSKIADNDFKDHDFILIEGLTVNGSHIFEVFDPEISNKLKSNIRSLSAIISDKNVFKNIKHFKRDDIIKIADYIVDLQKLAKESK